MLDGCTFDDFGILEGRGVAESRKQILARLQTKFSTNINLNIPLVSANMDTITRARMAIAHAKKGGIGIIDRFLTIEDQCEKVAEVKRHENFVITEPYSILPSGTVAEARDIMRKNKVGGLVVIKENGKLVGILTDRDIRFCRDDISVKNRMTNKGRLITAGFNINLEQAKQLLDKHRLEKLPLVDENFKLKGLITSQDLENLERYPLANKDKKGQLVVGAAIGVTGDYLERAQELLKAGVDVLVIDIAHGYSEQGERALKSCRKRFPDAELVVGNVASGESVSRLQSLGANGVKVGIGPGSACMTRYYTNIAPPQGGAVYNCARVAKVPIGGDGGIRRDGHIFLCLLLGADWVMIGGRYAGTDETPGRVIDKSSGKKVKTFRGMASREAMVEKFRAELSENPYEDSARISPEGKEDEVEYKGSVVPIIDDMMGHLTSSISYMGATSLKEAKEMFMANPKKYLKKLSLAAQKESWDR
ncbi:MAG: hypothetical protein A3C61_03745 [Candidatus Yanofskybacteria bacterium RIFCSPHIGHO2_02_FULL_39_10]|uniref:CBS domain-containing protein n=1 Tax=Candidatus Yanofskybacteria bacterium RIFCSPHIGHO2_02_FULL_39_10 TaxID=1802674 RepID=A0A1F8F690_9BACT|nr:MAG: hypothetical protein A3C61_03745 [Candidatus Yanofskybacteria bacterium RIFCSPHIGHO2_02_FULL_39_10]